MSNQNTAVAKSTKRDIRDYLQSEQVKNQISLVLPKHLTPERMTRVALTAILKTPKLAQCSTESLLQALMLCSQAGLEPDGRNAHLIPYGDTVQVIFDWKGLVSLARDNGVQNIAADVVCENDTFEWSRTGDGLQFKHIVDWRKPRGPMFAAFCIWKDGPQFDGEVMTKEEIEVIRKRSKAGASGPWVTDYNEMAKKTVIRRASKKWPLNPEFNEAIVEAEKLEQIETPLRPVFAAALENANKVGDDIPMGDESLKATPPVIEGQPKKHEVAKTVTKKTATAKPEEKTTPAPEPPIEGGTTNFVRGLTGLIKLINITEPELMDFLHSVQGVDETLTTLAEMNEVAPAKLAAIYNDWQAISPQLVAAKQKLA